MSTAPLRIYHNPSCSKSCSACALIAENGIAAEVVEYLQTPPTREELRILLKKLGMKPAEIVRQGEAVFKEHYAGRTLTDEEWLAAMVEHPILIERPIVVCGDKAILARPPEKVLELL